MEAPFIVNTPQNKMHCTNKKMGIFAFLRVILETFSRYLNVCVSSCKRVISVITISNEETWSLSLWWKKKNYDFQPGGGSGFLCSSQQRKDQGFILGDTEYILHSRTQSSLHGNQCLMNYYGISTYDYMSIRTYEQGKINPRIQRFVLP